MLVSPQRRKRENKTAVRKERKGRKVFTCVDYSSAQTRISVEWHLLTPELPRLVIPAKAGIQWLQRLSKSEALDASLRWHDGTKQVAFGSAFAFLCAFCVLCGLNALSICRAIPA
jgi:hypothetical protein